MPIGRIGTGNLVHGFVHMNGEMVVSRTRLINGRRGDRHFLIRDGNLISDGIKIADLRFCAGRRMRINRFDISVLVHEMVALRCHREGIYTASIGFV